MKVIQWHVNDARVHVNWWFDLGSARITIFVKYFVKFGHSGHSAILVIGPPKPEGCWGGKSKDKCEEFILTVGAQHDQDLNPEYSNCESSSLDIVIIIFGQVFNQTMKVLTTFLDD